MLECVDFRPAMRLSTLGPDEPLESEAGLITGSLDRVNLASPLRAY